MASDHYFGLTNDDILHGFRAGAILGQWLSGMARMSLATDDQALRGKAVALMDGISTTPTIAAPAA